jgi:cytochrome d ubiquinol oxidase subunit II
VPALLWGVAFANIVGGVPIDKNMEFTGNLLTLLNPYGLLGGLVTLSLFITHGAAYLALKTEGDLRDRANKTVSSAGWSPRSLRSSSWAGRSSRAWSPASAVVSVLAAVALLGALGANLVKREGWAFIGTALTIALAVVALFLHLYPNVMPSSTDPAFSLTITNAASTDYTLTIMTVVAVIFTPLVLLYQGWTYWVFRKRISADRIPDVPPSLLRLPRRGRA